MMIILSSGCSIKSDMMAHLTSTIVNNDDLSMVEAGAPAYLLMVDSLISEDPDSKEMLATAAQLYLAYADLFVTDLQRSRKMVNKAVNYADKALCISNDDACGLKDKSFGKVQGVVASMDRDDLPYLFALGNAWAAWIMVNTNDFNALADISRIEVIMLKVTQLDESYKDGAAFLYLGTMATFLPPALGGKPDQGKIYFEKAIDLSRGKNLMAKVMFAKLYAKMIFNRQLHDALLTEVIDTDPVVPGYTLINIYAQKQARQLLDDADDYF
ncbi:MAG: hypothetical protein GY710_09840 [Desulfobacteraceae bacterium]|nr:hypothetical protein [Desulfobacteraceae bacterium]